MKTLDFPITKTRYPELRLAQVTRSLWRYVTEDNAIVGPFYKTKLEALADLDNYARFYGCAGA